MLMNSADTLDTDGACINDIMQCTSIGGDGIVYLKRLRLKEEGLHLVLPVKNLMLKSRYVSQARRRRRRRRTYSAFELLDEHASEVGVVFLKSVAHKIENLANELLIKVEKLVLDPVLEHNTHSQLDRLHS